MAGIPQLHLPQDMGTIDSPDSSLAVSPLSTDRGNCESLASTGADSTRPAISTLFAKVDVSDLLAPLEARFFERLDSLEAMLERRCGALECRVGVLTAASAASSDSAFQQQLKVLQAQMEATMGSLQSYMEKESVRISALTEKSASLQSGVEEIWRQLKADRQRQDLGLHSCHSLSELEPRLRSLLDKVDRRCNDLGLPETLVDKGDREEERPLSSRAAHGHGLGAAGLSMSPSHGRGPQGPLLSVPPSPQLPPRSPSQQPSEERQDRQGPGLFGPTGSHAYGAVLGRLASAPALPLRLRSPSTKEQQNTASASAGEGLPAQVQAQAQQRAPLQRMVSAGRPTLLTAALGPGQSPGPGPGPDPASSPAAGLGPGLGPSPGTGPLLGLGLLGRGGRSSPGQGSQGTGQRPTAKELQQRSS